MRYFSAVVYLLFILPFVSLADEIRDADEIGKPFYDFKAKTLSGDSVGLKDYQGKVLLINVWDTVCPPCIAEFPSFVDFYARFQKDGFEMLGLTQALYADENGVKKFLQEHNITYPNAIVSNELLAQLPKGKGIPKSYLIDKDGLLVKKYVGFHEKQVFEKDILKLLKPEA